jgi:hypothetical protein
VTTSVAFDEHLQAARVVGRRAVPLRFSRLYGAASPFERCLLDGGSWSSVLTGIPVNRPSWFLVTLAVAAHYA